LWQIRINAAARAAGTTYSRFMEGLKAAKVSLDRKILADLAATDNGAFNELVKVAQNALKTKAAKA
jgi:large subunit ribosomal protein L20